MPGVSALGKRTPRQDPVPVAVETSRSAALRPWLAAVANRQNARADAVFFGSSMVEGGPSITTRGRRWLEQLQTGLRAQYPVSAVGGLGYTPVFYQTFTGGGAPWAYAGGTPVQYNSGLGNRAWGLTAAGQSATRTFTGTGCDIFFATHTTASPVAGIQVDGGTVNTLNLGSTTLKSGIVYQVRGLTAGSHTVVVTWSSGGPVVLDGMKEYNGDETSGIHLWDGGKGSSRADQFSPGAPSNRVWQPLGTIQPGLIAFEWIYNEYMNNFETPAAYATALSGVVSAALANITVPPTVLFLCFADPNSAILSTPYSAYQQVMKAQAAATTNGVFLDFGPPRMPVPRSDNTLGLAYIDLVHHSDKGAMYVADVLRSVLSTR